jgi:LmbE family N-acetylglucosaminyl deacetylase
MLLRTAETTGTDMNLLFSFAHPDDESFSAAGTAMKFAAAGARIVLVTATLGQKGKCGHPPVCAPEDIARTREHELRDAARIIGFDALHILGYEDQALASAPPQEIRTTLVGILRRERPDVVFTFDPNGFNVHPDHVAISRFTADAVSAAADPRWHAEAGDPHVVKRLLWTPLFPPWEAAKVPRLHEAPSVDFAFDVSAWTERRIAALRAHRTQHLSIDRCFFEQTDVERVLATEIWRSGFGPPLQQRPARDLEL